MKHPYIFIALLVSIAFLSVLSGSSVNAQTQIVIMPNYNAYLDSTTSPITYHVVGEVSNIGSVVVAFLNITADFYDADNIHIGSLVSYAFLNVLLPNTKTPFEIIWPGTIANQIHNYTLSLNFIEYYSEKPQALQILENTIYIDEAGFLKVNGTVRNTATSNATAVKVAATFYGAQGEVIHVAHDYTVPSTITPSSTEIFELEIGRGIGNYSGFSLTTESDEYAYTGTGVTIDYGAAYTTGTSITLTITSPGPSSDPAQVRFSNNNVTFTRWENYTNSKPWILDGGDGNKALYVQFKDSNNFTSPIYYDTIILDRTPPGASITFPINGTEVGTSNVTITWTGSDATSGIHHYEVKLDAESWINTGAVTSHIFSGLDKGNHTAVIKAVDRAGLFAESSTSFILSTDRVTEPVNLGLLATVAILIILLLAVAIYVLKFRNR